MPPRRIGGAYRWSVSTHSTISPAEDRERVRATIRASLSGRQPRLVQLHYRVVTAGGERRHVEANCRKVWGADGKSLIVAIVRDIEERVQLERRLAEEMGNLRSIVESMVPGYC